MFASLIDTTDSLYKSNFSFSTCDVEKDMNTLQETEYLKKASEL